MNWSPLAFNEVSINGQQVWYVCCTYLTDRQRAEFERQINQTTNRDLVLIPCKNFDREQLTLVIKLVLAIY